VIYRVCCLAGSASGLGTGGGFTYVLQDLRGGDPKALAQVVRRLTIAANQNPLLTRVFSTFSATNPSIYLDIDRDKAQVLGVQLNDVFQALQASLGGYYVNDLNLFGRRWQVNVQAEGNDRASVDDIYRINVRAAAGRKRWAAPSTASPPARWISVQIGQ
jgi:multidrug efflux pump subunit AcrB